jgi:radical SAM protein with 4Fe4S-binding SPASM domain
VGADRHARAWLLGNNKHIHDGVSLWSISLFRHRNRGDIAARLLPVGTSKPKIHRAETRPGDLGLRYEEVSGRQPGLWRGMSDTRSPWTPLAPKTENLLNGEISTFSPELLGYESQQHGAFVFGNIHQNELADVLHTPKFLLVNAEIQRGIERCRRTCDYFEVCRGGAPANKFFENGTFDSTETLFCRLIKKAVIDVVLERIERIARSRPTCRCGKARGFLVPPIEPVSVEAQPVSGRLALPISDIENSSSRDPRRNSPPSVRDARNSPPETGPFTANPRECRHSSKHRKRQARDHCGWLVNEDSNP